SVPDGGTCHQGYHIRMLGKVCVEGGLGKSMVRYPRSAIGQVTHDSSTTARATPRRHATWPRLDASPFDPSPGRWPQSTDMPRYRGRPRPALRRLKQHDGHGGDAFAAPGK